jgi:hypothetical protein
MNHHRWLWAVLFCLALAGCATSPVNEGYTGPTATIRDSANMESDSRALFFFVSEVDGKHVPDSLTHTRSTNYGKGFILTPSIIERKVPARPTILKLEGRTAYGAPIQEIVMASQMYEVTDVIEFEPKPNGRYVVQGTLQPGQKSVWLEDEATHQRVGKSTTR